MKMFFLFFNENNCFEWQEKGNYCLIIDLTGSTDNCILKVTDPLIRLWINCFVSKVVGKYLLSFLNFNYFLNINNNNRKFLSLGRHTYSWIPVHGGLRIIVVQI